VEIPHITLGSAREQVDGNEVEALLRRWRDSDSSQGRIWSIGLFSRVELEGEIRPVLHPLPIQVSINSQDDSSSEHSHDASRIRRLLRRTCFHMCFSDKPKT